MKYTKQFPESIDKHATCHIHMFQACYLLVQLFPFIITENSIHKTLMVKHIIG